MHHAVLPQAGRRIAFWNDGISKQRRGFPHGGHNTKAKLYEAELLIAEGCLELDMVVNISRVLSGDWKYVTGEVASIVNLAHDADRKVKVIFENCYLNQEQKIRLCKICCETGADWAKTSTGYGTSGATFEDLQLMLDNVTAPVQVKAAGGIRDCDNLIKAKQLGVTRVGASRTAEMLDEARQRLALEPIKLVAGLRPHQVATDSRAVVLNLLQLA